MTDSIKVSDGWVLIPGITQEGKIPYYADPNQIYYTWIYFQNGVGIGLNFTDSKFKPADGLNSTHTYYYKGFHDKYGITPQDYFFDNMEDQIAAYKEIFLNKRIAVGPVEDEVQNVYFSASYNIIMLQTAKGYIYSPTDPEIKLIPQAEPNAEESKSESQAGKYILAGLAGIGVAALASKLIQNKTNVVASEKVTESVKETVTAKS